MCLLCERNIELKANMVWVQYLKFNSSRLRKSKLLSELLRIEVLRPWNSVPKFSACQTIYLPLHIGKQQCIFSQFGALLKPLVHELWKSDLMSPIFYEKKLSSPNHFRHSGKQRPWVVVKTVCQKTGEPIKQPRYVTQGSLGVGTCSECLRLTKGF